MKNWISVTILCFHYVTFTVGMYDVWHCFDTVPCLLFNLFWRHLSIDKLLIKLCKHFITVSNYTLCTFWCYVSLAYDKHDCFYPRLEPSGNFGIRTFLQWENTSLNVSSVVTDATFLTRTVVVFFPTNTLIQWLTINERLIRSVSAKLK